MPSSSHGLSGVRTGSACCTGGFMVRVTPERDSMKRSSMKSCRRLPMSIMTR